VSQAPPHSTLVSSIPGFDPRRVPIVGVDAHLPAVGIDALSPSALAHRFAHPPAWAAEFTQEKKFLDRQPALAAVLVPIVMRAQPMVLLTERPAHMKTHAGQIAFPGGKSDDTDADATATALREAHEEVGLEAGFIDVLGHLPIYTTGSAFIITPVVALVRPGFVLNPNAGEVADAFEVPLHFLMNPANHRRHLFEAQGVSREWLSMPWQDGDKERFIWGATAGMLRNLYRFLSA
jgi:8-oxo-dGTP pyrophosphatase MutT (NUDIX family)